MSNNDSITAKRLKELVDLCNNRASIAQAIGCDASTISRHVSGERSITPEFLKKYAKFFNVSTDYLLGLTDVRTNDLDLRYMCEFTGLSEETILFFMAANEQGSPFSAFTKSIEFTIHAIQQGIKLMK